MLFIKKNDRKTIKITLMFYILVCRSESLEPQKNKVFNDIQSQQFNAKDLITVYKCLSKILLYMLSLPIVGITIDNLG